MASGRGPFTKMPVQALVAYSRGEEILHCQLLLLYNWLKNKETEEKLVEERLLEGISYPLSTRTIK